MFRDSKNINSPFNFKLVENLSAQEFAEKLNSTENAVLLDVRTEPENKTSRIPNSKLLDVANPFFLQKLDRLDRNKNYFLYCSSGNRSFIAGNQMLKIGFKKVYNLAPGIIGWQGEIEKG